MDLWTIVFNIGLMIFAIHSFLKNRTMYKSTKEKKYFWGQMLYALCCLGFIIGMIGLTLKIFKR
jgi:hypothetical protein